MEDLLSKSRGDGRMLINGYHDSAADEGGPNSEGIDGVEDLNWFSASSAPFVQREKQTQVGANDVKLKKGKATNGSGWKSSSLNDPKMQRKKRVAGYEVYMVEGKVKGSVKKSLRWVKEKYTKMVLGHDH